MPITVLQDHTDFFERVLLVSFDHAHGLPLGTNTLEHIRTRSIVCRYRGAVYPLAVLREMAQTASPGAEREAIARAMAAGVEGEIEGWYCVADDDGAKWLESHHVGPLLRWNGAFWWGRLKDIQIDTEVVTHDAFTRRKKRRQPGRGQAKEERARGNGPLAQHGQGLRRPDMRAFD